jgi:carbon-monoxide dehydrogenase small subunit
MHERVEKYVAFTVNGKDYEFSVGNRKGQIPESETLVHTLRDRLDLTGTKIGCDQGACGSCTVIMNGKATASCMTFTLDCDGSEITTIEGLTDTSTGNMNGLQKAFADHTGFQCGFCTSGIIMTAQALLNEVDSPSEDEIREALAGNYCRCGTHYSAVDSIMTCVEQRRSAK